MCKKLRLSLMRRLKFRGPLSNSAWEVLTIIFVRNFYVILFITSWLSSAIRFLLYCIDLNLKNCRFRTIFGWTINLCIFSCLSLENSNLFVPKFFFTFSSYLKPPNIDLWFFLSILTKSLAILRLIKWCC